MPAIDLTHAASEAAVELARGIPPYVTSLLLFRAFPVVCYVTASTLRPGVKLGAGAAYLATSIFAWQYDDARLSRDVLTAYAYFLAVGLIVYAARGRKFRKPIVRGLSFASLLASCIVVPAGGLLGSASVATVVGWEVAFSSYSFLAESARGGRDCSLGDALFFILVNPTLVFTQRGEERAHHRNLVEGVRRSLLGLLILVAGALWLPRALAALPRAPEGYVGHLLSGGAAFLHLYAGHSGLASLQIGLMRMLGWRVPERYHYPFLSTSPNDFWRRWNIYLGAWIRLYLFLPLIRRLRETSLPAGPIGMGGAMLTFALVGALHDIAQWHGLAGTLPNTSSFLLLGTVLVLWQLAGRSSARVSAAPWKRALRRAGVLCLIPCLMAFRATMSGHP